METEQLVIAEYYDQKLLVGSHQYFPIVFDQCILHKAKMSRPTSTTVRHKSFHCSMFCIARNSGIPSLHTEPQVKHLKSEQSEQIVEHFLFVNQQFHMSNWEHQGRGIHAIFAIISKSRKLRFLCVEKPIWRLLYQSRPVSCFAASLNHTSF